MPGYNDLMFIRILLVAQAPPPSTPHPGSTCSNIQQRLGAGPNAGNNSYSTASPEPTATPTEIRRLNATPSPTLRLTSTHGGLANSNQVSQQTSLTEARENQLFAG